MKRRVLKLSLLPFAALAVLVLTLVIPLSAFASPQQHLMGTRQHYNATVRFASNLTYNNGPVMTGTSNVYAIFWEPSGSSVSSTYNSLIQRYFGDVGGSGLYHNNTQYTQSGGGNPSNAVLAGSWVDTASYPSGTLQDTDIQNEVTHAKSVRGWASSIHNIFFVFTARGENICVSGQCSFSTFCAYHSFFGSNTIYAAMPYTGTNLSACGVTHSPNGDTDADSTINVTSHEQMEAATDPLLNAWFDATGSEIGDKCAWTFGTLNSNGGDATWNGHTYYVQREWDNLHRGCRMTGP